MFNTFKRKSALSIPMAALALAVSSAYAATPGSSDDSVFYAPPTSLTANAPGTLLSYRTATVKLAGAPAINAWNVVYQSTTARGFNSNGPTVTKDNAVSGTVLVPKANWTGTGARPVILYAMGTHGLANNCAPSRQMAAGTDYETANISAALNAGYAVLVTDYAGYLNGQGATYLVAQSQAQSTLDIFRAATSIPNVGITSSAKVAVWGFSQGGQTAAKAAEIASTYAPGINVVGVAAGGVPANFNTVAPNLDGRLGFAFLASGVQGMLNEYGIRNVPINQVISPSGTSALAELSTQCVFKALLSHENQVLASYTTSPGSSVTDLLAVAQDVVDAQTLGVDAAKPSMPMYMFHGQADEFIQLSQDYDLKKNYCGKGAKVYFDAYPSEHIATLFQAAPKVLSWIGDRVAGTAAPSTCSTSTTPADTSLPNNGAYKVALNAWPLDAHVDLKTLKQTVQLPAASSFTAVADITNNTLDGTLNVPNFSQSLKIVGIGAQIGMKITPNGRTTGKTSLSDTGILTVTGTANVDITLTSVWGIPFGECKTETPVAFPLSYVGPVSGLGTGLSFTGTTSFPAIKGCVISAIMSAFFTGAGNGYSFTVTPPAPQSY
ncbi:MAG: lipase family protein [Aquabacterium sp.]